MADPTDEASASSSTAGAARASRLPPTFPRRQPKSRDVDHYKLLNEFDALLEDASLGRHQQMPNGVAVPAPEYTEENTAPLHGRTMPRASSGTSAQMSPLVWNRGAGTGASPSTASQFDSSFFRSGNFSALQGFGGRTAGTPNSRASSSASSAISAEGRLGSAVPPRLDPMGGRLGGLGASPSGQDEEASMPASSSGALYPARMSLDAAEPPIKAHRGLLGLLTTTLRRQPLEHISPRPHSVPVDIEEYQRVNNPSKTSDTLVVHGDDDLLVGGSLTTGQIAKAARLSNDRKLRPATTGETDVTPRTSHGALPPLRRTTDFFNEDDVLVDQKSAIDKELEEIQKLQRQRDADRLQREQERAERRRKRDGDHITNVVLDGSTNAAVVVAEVLPPERTIDDERQSLLDLIQQDIALLQETQVASHDALVMQERKHFRELTLDELSSKEEISIKEEAEHARRVQAIRERARLDDKYRDERERQRRWEIVRDTVVDEEQSRDELNDEQERVWVHMERTFYRRMDDPLMDAQVEERLMRVEHFETLEEEEFQRVEQEWLLDLERLFRRRLERTWTSVTSSQLTLPTMLYNRFCALTLKEQQQRRQILVSHEITHGVMWESFCEAIHPLVDRALWKLAMRETDGRVHLEREEQEDSIGVFHGCTSSRELVTRYAAVVRETALRRAQQREEALEDIFEDELAERILSQRDEREAFILFEEMWRRGIDAIRANLKRIHIQQSMDAADALRRAEVQRAMIEEERQKAARDVANQKRTTTTRTPPATSSTTSKAAARVRSPPPSLNKPARK